MKKVKLDKYMCCLAIEMTRRCNMNCKFCGKGKAQNIDISIDIINKTLSEMKGVFIESLRISGGEPLLTPDLICYLIDKIIDEHIYINKFCLFTNGIAHKSIELANSISKLLQYLRDIESEIRSYIKWSDSFFRSNYLGANSSKIGIVISDNGRDTDKNKIQSTYEFYKNAISDDDFCITIQSDSFDGFGQITLEGNAKDNFRELIGNKTDLNKVRILNNNYYFISKSANSQYETFLNDVVFINKTLTVSANGNVFPGCIMAYEKVDKYPMFNIKDCNKDFFKSVNDFCWKYPICEKASNIRNKIAAIKFCKDNNIKINDMPTHWYGVRTDIVLKLLYAVINNNERIARDEHAILPYLDFVEIEGISVATAVLNMFDNKIPLNLIQLYLTLCTNYDEYTIKNITPEWCRGFIVHITNIDKERKEANNKRTDNK